MDKTEILSLDKEQLQAAVAEVIKQEATKVIRDAVLHEEVRDRIKKAFEKKWHDDKDTWLEDEVKSMLHAIMWQSIKAAFEDAGMDDMVKETIHEHIRTDEFRESLKRRAIETVEETTFYIKPKDDMEPIVG